MVGFAKLLLKIVINNRVLPVLMVVNNGKNIEDYVSTLKKWFWQINGDGEIIA